MAHGHDRRDAKGCHYAASLISPDANRDKKFRSGPFLGPLTITIRGGGDPTSTMVVAPVLRMGPPPRSFAADAHGCIMVRIQMDPPNTRLWRDHMVTPYRELPSDRLTTIHAAARTTM
jgi:hypothetical protein